MSYTLSKLSLEHFPQLLNDVKDEVEWKEKSAQILNRWLCVVGPIPKTVAVQYHIHSSKQEDNHVRLHISYETGFGDQVTAYLLIPGNEAEPLDKSFPAILALHPTDAAGKDDVALESGRENRRYGYELVSRGYVVLAPDTITAGERIYPGTKAFQSTPFYGAHPEYSAVGKMIHDHQQGIDLLQSLAFVNADSIGAIGHSLGAYNAYFLSAMDKRIKAVVSSCGFCPFTLDPEPNRWGQRDWFSHLPKLTEELQHDRVPFEFHEIIALTAPRPVFNWFGQKDHIFPNWQSAAAMSLDISGLYAWMGVKDNYTGLLGNEGHDFPEYIRTMSYHFLDQFLIK